MNAYFQAYHDLIVKTVSETPLNAPIKYRVRDIANKMAILDREVKYLVNKAKIWKPKQEKPSPAANESKIVTDEADVDSDSASQTGTDGAAEPVTPHDSIIDGEPVSTDAKNDTEANEYSQTKPETDESSSSDKDDDETHTEL